MTSTMFNTISVEAWRAPLQVTQWPVSIQRRRSIRKHRHGNRGQRKRGHDQQTNRENRQHRQRTKWTAREITSVSERSYAEVTQGVLMLSLNASAFMPTYAQTLNTNRRRQHNRTTKNWNRNLREQSRRKRRYVLNRIRHQQIDRYIPQECVGNLKKENCGMIKHRKVSYGGTIWINMSQHGKNKRMAIIDRRGTYYFGTTVKVHKMRNKYLILIS